MSEYNNNVYTSQGLTFNEYLTKVFTSVAVGLGITALASFLMNIIFPNLLYSGVGSAIVIGACVLELVVNIYFAARLTKMSKQSAWICYILYSALTGISFSSLFAYYSLGSVVIAFGVTCIMFVVMAIIGHTTKTDLSKFNGLILPALIGLIIASIINIFVASTMLDWIINYAGIIIFLFLIAYDMQKLRYYYQEGLSNPSIEENIMIYGAFGLYLDFINLFIRLLQIFGKRRDD